MGAVVGEEDIGSAVGGTGVVDKPCVPTLRAGVDQEIVVGRLCRGHLHGVSTWLLVPPVFGESSGSFYMVNHFAEVFSDITVGGCCCVGGRAEAPSKGRVTGVVDLGRHCVCWVETVVTGGSVAAEVAAGVVETKGGAEGRAGT